MNVRFRQHRTYRRIGLLSADIVAKSQIARRQKNLTDDRRSMWPQSRYRGRQRVYVQAMRSPHIYTIVACTAKRNFDHECKKTFATKSALSSPERVHRNVRSRRKQTFVQKIAYACVDITNCLEDAWLRLRFAEIVSQIIASDNAVGGLNPSRPILFSVI
jgi:hypothetical protein